VPPAKRDVHELIQAAERQRPAAPAAAAGGFRALRQPLVWALLFLAFALGRLSVGDSRASGGAAGAPDRPPSSPGAPAAPGLSPTERLGGAPLEEMERALFDPQNRFSVLALTYAQTPRNRQWAQDLVSYLAGLDLPVAPPQAVGEQILILVGASPEKPDLDGLLARIRATPDASGRRTTFASAYLVSLDEALRRR
jgi:hypothetical protein